MHAWCPQVTAERPGGCSRVIPGQGGEGVTVYELEQGLQLIPGVKWGSLQGFEQRTDITSLNFYRLLKERCTHTHMLTHTRMRTLSR